MIFPIIIKESRISLGIFLLMAIAKSYFSDRNYSSMRNTKCVYYTYFLRPYYLRNSSSKVFVSILILCVMSLIKFDVFDQISILHKNDLLTSFLKLFSDGDSHDGHDHEPPIFEDKILAKLIDPVLRDGDINNDGMIDYSEFISASIRNQKGEGPVIELSS